MTRFFEGALAGIFCIIFAFWLAPIAMADDAGRYEPHPYVTLQHPDWSKDAVLYQLNTRQFTKEGTFRAAEAEMPRRPSAACDKLPLVQWPPPADYAPQ